jgi:hypothetical protein
LLDLPDRRELTAKFWRKQHQKELAQAGGRIGDIAQAETRVDQQTSRSRWKASHQ